MGNVVRAVRAPVFLALVSRAGDSWVAALRQLRRRVRGVEWEVERGSVFGVPNPEEV